MTSAPRFYHPDAESALLAAKKACRRFPGRWYGRASSRADAPEFHVYEGIKVVESHIYMRNELAGEGTFKRITACLRHNRRR